MPHENVVFIEKDDDRRYNTFAGPGWYFVDPEDRWERRNIEGPYKTEELAEKEYFAYCSAAYG
jgi:hypothetical protein